MYVIEFDLKNRGPSQAGAWHIDTLDNCAKNNQQMLTLIYSGDFNEDRTCWIPVAFASSYEEAFKKIDQLKEIQRHCSDKFHHEYASPEVFKEFGEEGKRGHLKHMSDVVSRVKIATSKSKEDE